MKEKVVIFCGGGSGGHVVPALTVIKKIQQTKNWKIDYIGSYGGIEKELVTKQSLPYRGISTGKLRRYLSWKNVFDLFKVFKGFIQAFFYLYSYSKKDCLVFSFGGFVSVPVVGAAWLQGKSIYIHEQTTRMGLANQIASPFAQKIFVSFESSLSCFFCSHKLIYTGYPVREECFQSKKDKILLNGKVFSLSHRPLLFVTGGGNGSRFINELVRDNIVWLKERFQILHQVGQAFEKEYIHFHDDFYLSIAFLGDHLIDFMKSARVVISRSGAGTVAELLACGKRSLLIPLKGAQKNEQFHNAQEAQKKLGSFILEEDQFNQESFQECIEILARGPQLSKERRGSPFRNGSIEIMSHLSEARPLKAEKSIP